MQADIGVAESDELGRMVTDDVTLDVNGIPDKIPKPFYLRVPILKAEPKSYEDWKKRGGITNRFLEATEREIKRIEKEVGKIQWERELRKRPPISHDDLDINRKIVEVLEGISIELTILREELRDRALKAGVPYKPAKYAMAIRSISAYPKPIASGEEALVLPGVGQSTALKIQEVIDTVWQSRNSGSQKGTLRRLTDDKEGAKAAALSLFTRVPGIGYIICYSLLI